MNPMLPGKPDETLPLEIDVREAAELLAKGNGVLLVDVRELWEYEICRIDGARFIPMGSVSANLQSLDTDDEVICYCHHGMRSLDVAVWLRAQGIGNVRSLAGGIDRWSKEIDPKVPRY
jgi:rhodanese-related sulfurtransferase